MNCGLFLSVLAAFCSLHFSVMVITNATDPLNSTGEEVSTLLLNSKYSSTPKTWTNRMTPPTKIYTFIPDGTTSPTRTEKTQVEKGITEATEEIIATSSAGTQCVTTANTNPHERMQTSPSQIKTTSQTASEHVTLTSITLKNAGSGNPPTNIFSTATPATPKFSEVTDNSSQTSIPHLSQTDAVLTGTFQDKQKEESNATSNISNNISEKATSSNSLDQKATTLTLNVSATAITSGPIGTQSTLTFGGSASSVILAATKMTTALTKARSSAKQSTSNLITTLQTSSSRQKMLPTLTSSSTPNMPSSASENPSSTHPTSVYSQMNTSPVHNSKAITVHSSPATLPGSNAPNEINASTLNVKSTPNQVVTSIATVSTTASTTTTTEAIASPKAAPTEAKSTTTSKKTKRSEESQSTTVTATKSKTIPLLIFAQTASSMEKAVGTTIITSPKPIESATMTPSTTVTDTATQTHSATPSSVTTDSQQTAEIESTGPATSHLVTPVEAVGPTSADETPLSTFTSAESMTMAFITPTQFIASTTKAHIVSTSTQHTLVQTTSPETTLSQSTAEETTDPNTSQTARTAQSVATGVTTTPTASTLTKTTSTQGRVSTMHSVTPTSVTPGSQQTAEIESTGPATSHLATPVETVGSTSADEIPLSTFTSTESMTMTSTTPTQLIASTAKANTVSASTQHTLVQTTSPETTLSQSTAEETTDPNTSQTARTAQSVATGVTTTPTASTLIKTTSTQGRVSTMHSITPASVTPDSQQTAEIENTGPATSHLVTPVEAVGPTSADEIPLSTFTSTDSMTMTSTTPTQLIASTAKANTVSASTQLTLVQSTSPESTLLQRTAEGTTESTISQTARTAQSVATGVTTTPTASTLTKTTSTPIQGRVSTMHSVTPALVTTDSQQTAEIESTGPATSHLVTPVEAVGPTSADETPLSTFTSAESMTMTSTTPTQLIASTAKANTVSASTQHTLVQTTSPETTLSQSTAEETTDPNTSQTARTAQSLATGVTTTPTASTLIKTTSTQGRVSTKHSITPASVTPGSQQTAEIESTGPATSHLVTPVETVGSTSADGTRLSTFTSAEATAESTTSQSAKQSIKEWVTISNQPAVTTTDSRSTPFHSQSVNPTPMQTTPAMVLHEQRSTSISYGTIQSKTQPEALSSVTTKSGASTLLTSILATAMQPTATKPSAGTRTVHSTTISAWVSITAGFTTKITRSLETVPTATPTHSSPHTANIHVSTSFTSTQMTGSMTATPSQPIAPTTERITTAIQSTLYAPSDSIVSTTNKEDNEMSMTSTSTARLKTTSTRSTLFVMTSPRQTTADERAVKGENTSTRTHNTFQHTSAPTSALLTTIPLTASIHTKGLPNPSLTVQSGSWNTPTHMTHTTQTTEFEELTSTLMMTKLISPKMDLPTTSTHTTMSLVTPIQLSTQSTAVTTEKTTSTPTQSPGFDVQEANSFSIPRATMTVTSVLSSAAPSVLLRSTSPFPEVLYQTTATTDSSSALLLSFSTEESKSTPAQTNTAQAQVNSTSSPLSKGSIVFFQYTPKIATVTPLVFDYPTVIRTTFSTSNASNLDEHTQNTTHEFSTQPDTT